MGQPLSPEEFVRTWQESPSVEQAAELAGLTIPSAQSRAAMYRRRGIPLKKFPRRKGAGRPALNVATLADVARKAS